ncbi:unnamed protein product [Mucor hiemalis]
MISPKKDETQLLVAVTALYYYLSLFSSFSSYKIKRMAGPFYYAVNQGHQPGVYTTWHECEQNVKGFKGARFKKFNTFNEAVAFRDMPITPPPLKKNKASSELQTANKENTYYTTEKQSERKEEDTTTTATNKEPIKENDDYIPLTQPQPENIMKRSYSDMDEDDFLRKYGNTANSTTIERVYNDIVIHADGEEIRDEPTVIQDMSTIMNNLSCQFDQYERLNERINGSTLIQ